MGAGCWLKLSSLRPKLVELMVGFRVQGLGISWFISLVFFVGLSAKDMTAWPNICTTLPKLRRSHTAAYYTLYSPKGPSA